MKECGFCQREVLEVQLAAEEACTNIILHAYESGACFLCVSVRFEEDKLKVMIVDHGSTFDPTEHMTLRVTMHPITHDDIDGPVGGWGIGLIL
jgi:serine/threonine-protein kinase RsbW